MADMTIKQAADEIRKGLRTFKAFEQAEQVLVMLEQREQMARDMDRRIDKAKAEAKQAEDELESAQQAVASAKSESEQILKGARANAVTIEAKAKQKAGQIIDSAAKAGEDRAAGIERQAKQNAEQIVAQAESDADALRKEMKRLQSELDRLKEEGRQRLGL